MSLRSLVRWLPVSLWLFATTAVAGPIFSYVSQGATAPHPSGLGTRVASGFWGIASTGGGFMDGEIEFVDGFALPAAGQQVSFDESDLARISFRHVESAFVGGGTPSPAIAVTATGSEIVRAVGQVTNLGSAGNPNYQLSFFKPPGDTAPAIITSVPLSLFVFLCCGAGGTFDGVFALDGNFSAVFVLHDATKAGGPPQSFFLNTSSTSSGSYVLTSLPEPTVGLLLAFAVGLRSLRARRR